MRSGDEGGADAPAGAAVLANLQALRAAAALAVVVFHVGLLPATALRFPTGAAGVDLFFVLSGFIIAHSAARGGRHFLAHRLIRVLPAYWIATLAAGAFALGGMPAAATAGWLGQSLLFLPHADGRPLLIFVAWTLVYELAFYALYWIALRLGTARAPYLCLVLLVALATVRLPGAPGPWPLLLEFAAGLTVFLLVERWRSADAIGAGAALAVAAAGVALLFVLPPATGYDAADARGWGRVLCWGLPATLVLLGLVAAERRGTALRSRSVMLLGAASYAIYLLHPIVVGQLLALAPRPAPATWLLCAGATAGVALVAVAFHRAVELPLIRLLRALLADRATVEQRDGA